jgi:hypothetical protein
MSKFGAKKQQLILVAGVGVVALVGTLISFGTPSSGGCGRNDVIEAPDTLTACNLALANDTVGPLSANGTFTINAIIGSSGVVRAISCSPANDGGVDSGSTADLSTGPDMSCGHPAPTAPTVCLTSTNHPTCSYFGRDYYYYNAAPSASNVLVAGSVNLRWHAFNGSNITYVVQANVGGVWTDLTPTTTNTFVTIANQGSVNFANLTQLQVQARNCGGAATSNQINIIDVKPTWTADFVNLTQDRPAVAFGEQCATCHRPVASPKNDPSGGACYANNPTAPNTCLTDGKSLGGMELDTCDGSNPGTGTQGIWKLVDQSIGSSASGGVLWSLNRRVFTATYDSSGNDTEPPAATTPFLHQLSATANAYICKGAAGSNACTVFLNNRLTVKVDPAAGTAPSQTYYARGWWPKIPAPLSVSLQMPARYNNGVIQTATDTSNGATGPNSLHPLTDAEYKIVKEWVHLGGSCN